MIDELFQITRYLYIEMRKVMKNNIMYNRKKLELHLDEIIQNNEIRDSIDWLMDISTTKLSSNDIVDLYEKEIEIYHALLLSYLMAEDYIMCAKLRDAINITTDDIIRLIKIKKGDDMEDCLSEVRFILDIYKKSVLQVLPDV